MLSVAQATVCAGVLSRSRKAAVFDSASYSLAVLRDVVQLLQHKAKPEAQPGLGGQAPLRCVYELYTMFCAALGAAGGSAAKEAARSSAALEGDAASIARAAVEGAICRGADGLCRVGGSRR